MTIVKESPPTYVTLGKDVNLKYLGLGRYDRDWYHYDFVQVKNIDSLNNAIRIAVMTILNELNLLEPYDGFGNGAWGVLKDLLTPLNMIKIQQDFITVLQNMRRIKVINDVKVEVDNKYLNTVNVTYNVTSIDDQLVASGVTLSLV